MAGEVGGMPGVRWVDKRERMPTREDADAQGCVLVWDINNGVMITGVNNHYGVGRSPVTHWATPPEGPGGAEDEAARHDG